jgi:hypothetical protein
VGKEFRDHLPHDVVVAAVVNKLHGVGILKELAQLRIASLEDILTH